MVRERIQPRVREIDEGCEYPRDLYGVMAEHNLLGLSVPSEFGGRCESDVSWCAYVEELAKVSGTVSLMAAYVKLVSLPLTLAGSEEQIAARAARAALGRAARLVRAVGAQRRLGPGRARDARGAPRRHVGAQRREAVHRQRRAQRRLRRLRAHGRRGRQGRQRLPRRRARRRRLLAEAAHDGHAGLAARRAALRGRRGAGGEPARPRGRRLPDRDGDLRPLPPDGRRAGGRPRRRARSTSRWTTRRAATRSASRCWPTRACSSSSPTWRPTSPPRGR